MTPRRLLVLIRHLPPDAAVWAAQDAAMSAREAAEKAALTSVERNRERAAHWAAQGH